ncbi:hypothetical protein IEQ34_026813 [Dendrobium chrysotoxum]|uniref:Uncharacterized protein n=1 Tax=Dendrobium chrysotoxum TaxID=161865 RepID=A0AAV7FL34_DENCH|nr:hypothetical protein IEQ34_026813 [Dendrobium chrysotoxum]
MEASLTEEQLQVDAEDQNQKLANEVPDIKYCSSNINIEERVKALPGEQGSSRFEALFGTKSAKKNYLRRVRKKITKLRKIAAQKALSLVEPEAAEELPIPASSPLLKGSRFHPLTATAGEERVTRIASSPPSSVDYSVKRTSKEKHTMRTRMLRNIIHTCAAQSVRRNKKFVKQLVTSVLVDGYHWVPRLPSVKTKEIVLNRSGKGHPPSGRPPIPPSRLSKLAPLITKSIEIVKDLRPVDIKGKRPMPSDEPYIPMKLSRSTGIQIQDLSFTPPVDVPHLPT